MNRIDEAKEARARSQLSYDVNTHSWLFKAVITLATRGLGIHLGLCLRRSAPTVSGTSDGGAAVLLDEVANTVADELEGLKAPERMLITMTLKATD